MRTIEIRGRLEWTKPQEKFHNPVLWVDDANGNLTRIIIKYNWFERLLIRLRMKKDRSRFQKYISFQKYIMGVDPINP
jgi:hypothetical protein